MCITNQTWLIFQAFASCPLNNLLLNSASKLMAEVMDAKPTGLWFLTLKIPAKPSSLMVFLCCTVIRDHR